MKKNKTYNLVVTAVLAALVVVLQIFASSFQIGSVAFSFVLIPIVLGGIIVGPYCGLFLGELFGFITLFAGILGRDAVTNVMWQFSPLRTIVICLVKAGVAGLVPGLLYKLIAGGKTNVSSPNSRIVRPLVGTIVASISAPVCNTGLFLILAYMFKDPLISYLNLNALGIWGFYVALFFIVILNFLVEIGTTAVITPAIFMAYKKALKK